MSSSISNCLSSVSQDKRQDECSICQQILQKPTVQLPCNHMFHFLCIEQLKRHSKSTVLCPNCRGKVTGVLTPASSATSVGSRPASAAQPTSDPSSRSASLRYPTLTIAVLPFRVAVPERPSFADDMPPVAALSRPIASIDLICIAAIGKEHIQDRNKPFDALVKISASRVPEATDTPSDVVIVADVSGSMTSDDKMPCLKESLHWLVDSLGDEHRMSVIVFNEQAERKSPLTLMNSAGKAHHKAIIDDLRPDGGTDISKGLELAKAVVGERTHKDRATIVLLLTDGRDQNPLSSSLNAVRDIASQVLFGFIGLGKDHDARLLSTLATEAKGRFEYCADAEVIAPTIGSLLATATRAAAVGLSLSVESAGMRTESRKPLFAEDQEHTLLFTSTLARCPEVKLSYRQVGCSDERHMTVIPDLKAELTSQNDLVLIDSHKNREAVATLLRQVAELDESKHDEALSLLDAMIDRLQHSLSKDDLLTKTLIGNCQKTKNDLPADQESQQSRYATVISVSMSHSSQAPSQALTLMSQVPLYSPSVCTLSSARAAQAVIRARNNK